MDTKANSSSATNLGSEVLLELYRQMQRIRQLELRLAQELKTGEIPGPAHLYVGQEAIATGICAHLTDEDTIASNHRGHGHYLAKGGLPRDMIAEIYGRATGICGGRGGSMHVADFSRGILGANGIVGGGIGLAVGAALAAQLDGKGAVSTVFFGDGGANQGVLSEALNVSAVWKLPLILICENNGFSEFSPASTVTAGRIVDRASPYGIPGVSCDGNDVVAVWQTAAAAVRRARDGGGPTLIEAKTYRTRGHVESEDSFLSRPYRDPAEVKEWEARDPIPRLAALLRADSAIGEPGLGRVDAEVAEEVNDAFSFAKSSPLPLPETATLQMFA